jgi:hypothetical protein
MISGEQTTVPSSSFDFLNKRNINLSHQMTNFNFSYLIF